MLRRLAIAAALCGLVLAGTAGAVSPAGAEKASAHLQAVRGGLHQGYARLVFEWDRLPQFQAKADGNAVVLSFGEPMVADFNEALARLEGRIADLEFSSDRRTIRLVLGGHARIRTFAYETVAIVDLIEPGAQIDIPRQAEAKTPSGTAADTPTATAKAVEPATAVPAPRAARAKPKLVTKSDPAPSQDLGPQAATPPMPLLNLGIETRDYGNFSRLIFDWNDLVEYEIERNGLFVSLRFDAPAKLDAAELRTHLPRRFADVDAELSDGSLTVQLAVATDMQLRHFQKGNRIVLDAIDPTAEANADRPSWATQGGGGVGDAAPTEVKQPAPQKPDVAAAAPDGSTLQVERSAEVAAGGSTLGDQKPPSTARITAEGIEDGVRLRFHLSRDAAAAVFRRAGHLWAVFDSEERVDLDGLAMSGSVADILQGVEQLPVRGATALRFRVAPGRHAHVARSGSSWIIEVSKAEQAPAHALAVHPKPAAQGGARALIPAAGVNRTISVYDPEVGDLLVVVPVAVPGTGVKLGRQFVQFGVLPSAQGAVIWPRADHLLVRAGATGIEVSSSQDLVLSSEVPPEHVDPTQGSHGGDLPREPLFAYDAWQRNDLGSFVAAKQRLQNAIVVPDEHVRGASEDVRGERRLDLARFYFAHGFAADAIGVIQRIADEDTKTATSPEFLALRGATLMLLGRIGDAMTDLNDKSLDGDMDVILWRAGLSASRGDWEAADSAFAISGPAFERLPPTLRARFGLLAAHAALSVSNVHRAVRLLERVEKEAPAVATQREAQLLRAKAFKLSGKTDAALRLYETLSDAGHRPVRARAGLERVELMLQLGRMTRREAIEVLEGLRHIWRGDTFEQRLLRRLGELYREERNYMNALSALRDAVETFPESPMTPQVEDEMLRLFSDLFVEGGADDLTPLAALGLYYEFGELAPQGAAGARIVEGLANRLVAVDLLDRAEELLRDRINVLDGVDKARTGARLAVIQLLDKEAEKALETLEQTAPEGADLPKALVEQRNRLEASALSHLTRHDKALALVSEDRSRPANLLRADILWRAEKWSEAAAAIGVMFPVKNVDGAPLNLSDRHLVMRQAVALSLARDELGLERLRAGFFDKMAESEYAEAFDLLTRRVDTETLPFRELPKMLANVEGAEAFLDSIRNQGVGNGT